MQNSKPSIFDDLIAITEAAELWGTSISTIKRFIKEGKFIDGVDCKNFGRQWVITKDAMNRVFGVISYDLSKWNSEDYSDNI